MIYGFDTSDEHAATAALLVYAVYRSRDKARYKASPDMWEQIERFVKDSAKRAKTLPQFIESLKPRLACGSIRPRWMEVGIKGEVPMVVVTDPDTGAFSICHPARQGQQSARVPDCCSAFAPGPCSLTGEDRRRRNTRRRRTL